MQDLTLDLTNGAAVSIYLRDDTGLASHAAAGGGLPIGRDDPLVAALKARHQPLALAETPTQVAGELAAPMSHRNDLNGFLLLGPKRSGESYRPDESALLAFATQQIGLDLHALRIDALEAARLAEARENECLRARLDELRGASLRV